MNGGILANDVLTVSVLFFGGGEDGQIEWTRLGGWVPGRETLAFQASVTPHLVLSPLPRAQLNPSLFLLLLPLPVVSVQPVNHQSKKPARKRGEGQGTLWQEAARMWRRQRDRSKG